MADIPYSREPRHERPPRQQPVLCWAASLYVPVNSFAVICGLTSPIGRDKDFIASNMQFAIDVFQAAMKIRKYPAWMRPCVFQYHPALPFSTNVCLLSLIGNYLAPYKNQRKYISGHIGAVVAQRIAEDDKYGKDREDRPVRCIVLSAVSPEPLTGGYRST